MKDSNGRSGRPRSTNGPPLIVQLMGVEVVVVLFLLILLLADEVRRRAGTR